ETLGGGIPEAYRPYLNIQPGKNPTVSLKLPMELPSHILGQNRKAILRSGKGDHARTLSIDFTERVGHYHMAPLNLTFYAKGHELETDLGYLGSTHFLTVDWIKTFPAHNTVAIRTEDGDPMGTDNLRGDLQLFADLPGFKVIDAAEKGTHELAKIPGTNRYQRTVALIDASPEDAYVVDFFRLNGGHLHDWTFHSNGHRFETEGLALKENSNPAESLYDYSGFTFTPTRRTNAANAKWGTQRVTKLSTGQSTGPWTATWGDVTEFVSENAPPEIDPTVFLKLHMLDTPGSEIITGTGPAQRWIDNRDLGEEMKIITVRRKNTEPLDTFLAVHEPYRDQHFIKNVERLSCTTSEAEAVQVTHNHGTDLILSNPSGSPCTLSHNGLELHTDGELAFASFDPQGLRSLALIGGTTAESRGHKVESTPTLEGLLTGFDDVQKTLTVQTDQETSDPNHLAGKTITINHRERASAYTIRSAQKNPDGTYTLHLDGFPHLAIGYLLVTAVENDRVWVEPPPVIQGKDNNLNLFKVELDKTLTHLQSLGDRTTDDILDEWGCRIRTRNGFVLETPEHLSSGNEIALSLLHPGVDRIRIVGSGHWQR
ncbi:MAG: heparinase II/III family protein, partial [bacterium]|nr:heparinase II/III family protein [bacterium]